MKRSYYYYLLIITGSLITYGASGFFGNQKAEEKHPKEQSVVSLAVQFHGCKAHQ